MPSLLGLPRITGDDVSHQLGPSISHVESQQTLQPEAFSLVRWLRLHGIDILTMLAMGGVTLGLSKVSPVSTRTFPVYNLDGSIVFPRYARPQEAQAIPTWASAVISIVGPIFFFAVFQIRRRSWDDFLSSTMGLLRSIVTSSLIAGFIKAFVGGMRPHFYEVCKPLIPSNTTEIGIGFQNMMYDISICTTTDKKALDEALRSMPSGHTTTAWAGLGFLALYLNGQLKVLAGHNPAYWKMLLFFLPLLGAVLISFAAHRDAQHHWGDIIVGKVIGSVTAIVSFRQTFAAIYDFRFNHMLLPRATSLFHRKPYIAAPGRGAYYTYQTAHAITPQDLPAAREGGWDYGLCPRTAGAPDDAWR